MGHMSMRGRVIGHMGDGEHRSDGAYGQCGMTLLGLHGSRVMGHMGNRLHGQWDTSVMGHTAIIMYRSRGGTWMMGCMGKE